MYATAEHACVTGRTGSVICMWKYKRMKRSAAIYVCAISSFYVFCVYRYIYILKYVYYGVYSSSYIRMNVCIDRMYVYECVYKCTTIWISIIYIFMCGYVMLINRMVSITCECQHICIWMCGMYMGVYITECLYMGSWEDNCRNVYSCMRECMCQIKV